MPKVLFICTGNYYRSRLAEILFNYHAKNAGLDWEAKSRGLVPETNLKGLSESAKRYLEQRALGVGLDTARDPRFISVEDIEKSDYIIALNRQEHEPLLKTRFGQIPKTLEKKGRLTYWNVADLPMRLGFMERLLGPKEPRDEESEASGTEHVDFGVQALVKRLQEGKK